MKRSLIFRLLILSVVFLYFPVLQAQEQHRFAGEVDQLVKKAYHLDPDKKLLLFAGSSSIRKWTDVQQYFPGFNVINYGFGGSTYSDLLFFYDKLFTRYRPDILFIYEGDNDIAAGTSPEKIAEEADTLIRRLRRDLPETRSVIISAKPSLARWKLKDQYLALNERLEKLCEKYPEVVFADVWDIMLNAQGEPRKDIFIGDGLHMNEKGYRLWQEVLSKKIGSLTESTPPPARKIVMDPLFTDNMVLQRDQTIKIWGKAEPGSSVEVELGNSRAEAVAGGQGRWEAALPPMPAGGPYELILRGEKTYRIKNVMIGEVWVCSGQSNMEMPVSRVMNAKQEIAAAHYPEIRLLTVEKATSPAPLDTFRSAGWQLCTPKTVADFSAVAYFYGRSLYKELNVPIGLIHSSWGGTVIEAWTSAETLRKFPEFADRLDSLEKISHENIAKALKEYKARMKAREKRMHGPDAGMRDGKYVWNAPGLNTSEWEEMELPTLWERAGHRDLDGAVWFRKRVNIPPSMSGKTLTLSLGPVNDNDITWFNGVKVGETKGASEKRIYKIPASLVNKGTNVIVVRVFDIGNNGGIYGQPDELKITDDAGHVIPLRGVWKYRIGLAVEPVPRSPYDPNQPTVLYNAMIRPLIPYAIRGAIWYQGESNAGRAYQYRQLFPAMITDWRTHWDQGDFPFYFVQLANFLHPQAEPGDDAWAELREAQLMTLRLPNTGMAVTIDIGDADDIHPKNKQEVGRRLALNALRLTYGKDVENSGPLYDSMQIEGKRIRLTFTHVDGGLVAKGGGALKGFAIAGADKHFVWADAKIAGNTVVVSSHKVKHPVAVRYAWASNPVCNLYNKAGLPASPFRTDDWRGVTEGNR